MIASMANNWRRQLSPDRESVGSKEIEDLPEGQNLRIQDHLLVSCRSVLYESSGLFACVALTVNVMNSLFYSGPESVFDAKAVQFL